MALGKRKKEQPLVPSPGVTVITAYRDTRTEKNGNTDIMIKAIAVFLLSASSIYMYIDGIGLSMSLVVFFGTLAAEALILSLCYRSSKGENLVALLFLAVFVFAGINFRYEINSGFYAVVNTTIDRITDFFELSGMRTYTERVANRYVTVTAFSIAVGMILEYIVFNLVIWSASYVWCFILTIIPNLVIIYLDGLSSLPASACVWLVMMVYIALVRGGGHFRFNRGSTEYIRTRKGISYRVDKATDLNMFFMAIVIWVAGLMLALVCSRLNIYNGQSRIKESTEPAVKDAFLRGADGILNRYPAKGGLNSGRLGGVNRVTQDGQPDLEITFTPYSTDTLYIRNFIGEYYNPVDNYWTGTDDKDDQEQVSALKKSYKSGKGARACMDIKNVGADVRPYEPYYTDTTEITDGISGDGKALPSGATETVTYYPLISLDDMQIKSSDPGDGYRGVPTDIYQTVSDFCRRAGLKAGMDTDQAVERLRAYFQKNYPYTLSPGATPKGRDFVEYFLNENKKGYCAHYASSAVLIFRSLGIPARYCEGYAVSMESMANNAEREDELSYDDYYSGQNTLRSSAVIRTTASDMNAHAWVEVYEKGHGWVVADVTPAATEDTGGGGFLSDLMSLLTGGGSRNDTIQNNNVSDDNGTGDIRDSFRGPRAMWLMLVMILVLASPLIWIGMKSLYSDIRYRRAFAAAGSSDRLIMHYQRQTERRRRRDKEFSRRVNYEEQLLYLYPDMASEDRQRLKDILDKAGYSPHGLSDEEYEWAMNELGQSSRKRRHTASNSDRV